MNESPNNENKFLSYAMLLSEGLRGYAEVKVLQVQQQKVVLANVSKYACTLNVQQIYLHILGESL